MKKHGKELKIKTNNEYNVKFGCVDNLNAKSVYIDISSWMEPIEDNDLNYAKIVCDLNKKIKQQIYNHLYYNGNNEYILDRTIVDFDLKESGIRFGKRSFMNCQITLFTVNKQPITDIELQESLKNIFNMLVNDVFSCNRYFTYHKRKKDLLINA